MPLNVWVRGRRLCLTWRATWPCPGNLRAMSATSPAHATFDPMIKRQHDVSQPYPKVFALVSRADPEGLLAGGAPKNEYEAEAAELAAILRAGNPVSEPVLLSVWQWWFGCDSVLAGASPAVVAELAADLDALRAGRPNVIEKQRSDS